MIMRFSVVPLVLAFIGSVCCSNPVEEDQTDAASTQQSFVVQLTRDTFHSTIESVPVALVKFATPWCGYCKTLAPVYQEAAKMLFAERNHTLYEVNCQDEDELCRSLNIEGYPTMRVWYKGAFLEDFFDRTAEGIVSYIHAMHLPSLIVPKEKAQLEKLVQDKPASLFVYVSSQPDSSLEHLFSDFSDVNRSFGKFIQVAASDSDILSALPIAGPKPAGVYCLRSFDTSHAFLPEAELNMEALKDFVIFERFPAIMEVGKEALDIAQLFRTPIILVFYDTPEMLASILADFTEMAKSLRRQFVFSYSQGFQVAQNVGFKVEQYPLLAVYDIENNKPYLMPPGTPLTPLSVRHFLDNMTNEDAEAAKQMETESAAPKPDSPPVRPTQKEPVSLSSFLSTLYLSMAPLLL